MLTTAKIRALKPRAARYTVTDADGLGVEVMPTGLKVWRLRVAAEIGSAVKVRRVTLGRWPRMGIDAARAAAKEIGLAYDQGLDGAAEWRNRKEKSRYGATVREFSMVYTQEVIEKDRKNPQQLRRLLEREVWPRIGDRPLAQVTGAEIRELVFRKRDNGRPAAAAALRNLLKRMWDYALVCGTATANPVLQVPMKFITRGKTRSRTLSKAEVGLFLRRLYETNQISQQHKLALHLLLLTLARKSELRLATWGEIQFSVPGSQPSGGEAAPARAASTWEIPAEHSKTGKPHIVYLSQKAAQIINELFARRGIDGNGDGEIAGWRIFPGANSHNQPMSPGALNAALGRVKWGMPHFTIHDLRRTAATLLSEAGYAPDVIEKALNHTIKGVRGVYNRAEYGEQRKAMLEAWGQMTEKWRGENGRHEA